MLDSAFNVSFNSSVMGYVQLQIGGTNLSGLYAEGIDSFVNILHGVEAVLLVLHLVIPTVFLYITFNTAIFHINLVLVVNGIVFSSYPMAVGRFLFILWERGYFEHDVVLLSALTLVRTWYLYSLLFTQLAAFVERFIASIYIETYEKTRRLSVSILLIAVSNCLALALSVLMLLDLINFHQLLICMGLTELAILPMVFKIFRVNQLASRKFDSKKIHYSLSTRFQVNENIRMMKLTLNLTILTIFLAAIAGAMIFIKFSASTPITVGIIGMFYQIFMTSLPLLVFMMIILSFREYRSHFLSFFGYKRYSAKVSVVDSLNAKKHFDMLADSWK